MPSALRAKAASLLEGSKLDAVSRLEFSWAFDFGAASLTAGASIWRVVSSGRLTLTSADDGHRFGVPEPIDAEGLAAVLLVGRRVQSVTVDEETADIRITFEGGERLEILASSIGYEAWQLNSPESCIVAANEGRLSEAAYAAPQLMLGGPWE